MFFVRKYIVHQEKNFKQLWITIKIYEYNISFQRCFFLKVLKWQINIRELCHEQNRRRRCRGSLYPSSRWPSLSRTGGRRNRDESLRMRASLLLFWVTNGKLTSVSFVTNRTAVVVAVEVCIHNRGGRRYRVREVDAIMMKALGWEHLCSCFELPTNALIF